MRQWKRALPAEAFFSMMASQPFCPLSSSLRRQKVKSTEENLNHLTQIWKKGEREKRHCGTSSVLMWCPLLNTEGLYSLSTNTWWNTDFKCADNKTIMAIHFLRGQKPQFYFTHCSNKIWINWVNFIHEVCDTAQCFTTMWFYCYV